MNTQFNDNERMPRKTILYLENFGAFAAFGVLLQGTLFDHLTQPEFQMRLRWAPGTVAIWDNRCTQHYVSLDYMPNWRRMHRVTLVNDRRVDAQEQGQSSPQEKVQAATS